MKNFWLFSLPVLLLCGCGHTPVRSDYPAAMPPNCVKPAVAQQRADDFKKIISGVKTRGVVIFPQAFFGRFEDEKVLDCVENLGFNRIYCHLTSEQELDERLMQFLAAAGKRNIPVEALLSQQDFYRKYRANRLIRNLFVQYPDLPQVTAEVLKFNQELPGNGRFAAMTIRLTPELFDGSNVRRLQGKLYCWGENRYGIGGDNDMLVKESIELLEQISGQPGMLPLTVAVPDFLNEAAENGKLAKGKVTDFAGFGKVAVVSFANLPSKIPASVQDELKNAGKSRVLAVIPLAGHTAVDSGQLRRRNWMDFQRSINHLIRKSSMYPAFDGIIVSPLAVIEYMRMEE